MLLRLILLTGKKELCRQMQKVKRCVDINLQLRYFPYFPNTDTS